MDLKIKGFSGKERVIIETGGIEDIDLNEVSFLKSQSTFCNRLSYHIV